MPASYTSLLRFAKPGLGDTGWGTTVNGGFTDMTEQALTGAISKAVTVAGPNTLGAIADGASSDARNQFVTLTGTLASPATLTVPAGLANNSKLYFIKNSAGNSVTITTGGVDTVVVPDGASMALRVTTTGVEQALTHQTTLSIGTLTLTNALGATSGGTGQTGYAVGDLLYASSTTALSKLTIGATNAVLTVAAGIPTWTPTLGVASGGTGAATLAANNVLLGNGTSAVQTVAPGTAGNVLTSNGTTWTSAAALGVNAQVYTSGTGNFTIPAGVTKLKVTVVGGGGGSAGSVSGNTGGAGGGGTNGDLNVPGGSLGGYGVGGDSLYASTSPYGSLGSALYGGGASASPSASGPGAAGATGVVIFEW